MTIDTITNPTTPTDAQLRAGLNVLIAVSESIRELGEVPSGTLYAALIGKVNYAGYEAILQTLTNAGLIQVMPSHMIRWVGPTLAKESL